MIGFHPTQLAFLQVWVGFFPILGLLSTLFMQTWRARATPMSFPVATTLSNVSCNFVMMPRTRAMVTYTPVPNVHTSVSSPLLFCPPWLFYIRCSQPGDWPLMVWQPRLQPIPRPAQYNLMGKTLKCNKCFPFGFQQVFHCTLLYITVQPNRIMEDMDVDIEVLESNAVEPLTAGDATPQARSSGETRCLAWQVLAPIPRVKIVAEFWKYQEYSWPYRRGLELCEPGYCDTGGRNCSWT